MIDKKSLGSDDLIYNSVEYIAKNFRNEISLEKMALDLGVGKYVLSRMFAKTFHCNFNNSCILYKFRGTSGTHYSR